MSDTIYEFYLESNYLEAGHMLIFKGTLADFIPVEQKIGELWAMVIDSQLSLLERKEGGGYPINQLTEDEVMLNWEGCDIYAVTADDKNKLYYLGDGILDTG
jgi:hypothetical protein|tara:strand:+ start:231 stop:536 length:306 start_codon:yes stop_codon:yes gene_type:complete